MQTKTETETELKAVYASSYMELRYLYPNSFCRRPRFPGSRAYQGLIEVPKKIHYTISCYKGRQQVWTVTKENLGSVARFVIDSEKYRTVPFRDVYSIMIKKEYVDYPGEYELLESWVTNDSTLVEQLAINS